MTKDTINKLPEIFKRHMCSLKKASLDDANSTYMSMSALKVIHFDKIPNEYCRKKGLPFKPKSNDALYITSDDEWHFIEFKNGSIEKADIYRKLYDSLIMLIDLGMIPDLDFTRNNMVYTLVYNSDKQSVIPPSKSRDINFSYITSLGSIEKKLFDIDKFENYLLKETHTYTKHEFESHFTKPMETMENTVDL